jgi:hypothetical protein
LGIAILRINNFYFFDVPLILTVLFLISISFAAEPERLGAGSRELARGNAMAADTSAFFVSYWNPGMLAFKRNLSAGLHGEKRSPSMDGGTFGIDAGVGNRMGIGATFILRDDYIIGYTGLGYRISKKDGIGFSLSSMYLIDEFQSPLSFDLGWFRYWNAKWQSGLSIRNLGFNSKLSASWRGNDYEAFRPKTFEAGLTHRNLLAGKPASVSLSVLSYQEADTLFVFDPDWHVFKGRFGIELETNPGKTLRIGIDGKSPTAGWSQAFKVGNKTLSLDYAIIYEWEAEVLNPLSLSLRMKF